MRALHILRAQKKRTSEHRVNEMFNRQDFKADANNVLLWLRIGAVFRECNSTAELTLNVCSVVVYWDGSTRTAPDRMCAVARYYDISSKADCGDIFIIHDQKSSYRTPLCSRYLFVRYLIHLSVNCVSQKRPIF